jgi:hypothetical protein
MMCVSSTATMAFFAPVYKVGDKLLTALDGIISRPNNFLKSHEDEPELFDSIVVLGDPREVFANE